MAGAERTLVEAEITARDASNARTRMKQAAFPVTKTLEEFDRSVSPVPAPTLDYLICLEWIRAAENPDLEIPTTRGLPQLRRNLVRDLAALNKTEMLLWEDWGMQDSRTPPGPDELQVLDELATLTGQPSPPLAGLRSAYRRPEFAVPDTVTSYSPARTDVPAVVDVSAVARAAS